MRTVGTRPGRGWVSLWRAGETQSIGFHSCLRFFVSRNSGSCRISFQRVVLMPTTPPPAPALSLPWETFWAQTRRRSQSGARDKDWSLRTFGPVRLSSGPPSRSWGPHCHGNPQGGGQYLLHMGSGRAVTSACSCPHPQEAWAPLKE